MSRIKTFSTRLKVITNIEDRGGGLLQSLNNNKLPDANTNTGETQEAKFKSESASASDTEQTDSNNPTDQRLRKDSEELDKFFSMINRETLYLEQMLQDQYELLVDQKDFLLATPTRKPSPGYVTSGFGIRKSPYGGRVKMHEGLDIANYPGTAIKAPANGVVVYAAEKPGYGQTVIIDHGYGLETWYGHARKLLVGKGQKIKRGDTIAQVGSSGRSTGPHVHYEVRINGIPVNPLSYFLEN
jgi:murein DD-endopeptidase MepM/ murein hydrolase activator NlpD